MSAGEQADARLERELRAFLLHEARLLDQGRFEAWLALYAEDGVYWIPASRGQADPRLEPSLLYEDKPLLAMRIARLSHPRVHAATPVPRTVHLVTNIELAGGAPGGQGHRVLSNLLVVEYRNDEKRLFAGHCEHVLRTGPGGIRIASKRVDLVDCDGTHEVLSLPL